MSETPDDQPLLWVKSTRSAGSGECVEVARTTDGVAVRDSKDPNGPVLCFGREAWQGFVRAVIQGDLQAPASR